MGKYIQGKDGKFAGSVGSGKVNVPTVSDAPSAPAPSVRGERRDPADLVALYSQYQKASEPVSEEPVSAPVSLPAPGADGVLHVGQNMWVNNVVKAASRPDRVVAGGEEYFPASETRLASRTEYEFKTRTGKALWVDVPNG